MKEKVHKIFEEVFEVNPIPENFSKHNNESWDSLKHLSLIVEIEAAFDISLSPEEIYKIDSVSAALECIKDKNQ
jgi:acyl carrier protein